MTAPRVLSRVLRGVVPAAVLVVLGAAPAHAGEYRYWSFWERDGQEWTYATQGPGTLRPEDGDVLGFRFAVSEDSGDADRPRGEADFAAICEGTEPRPGSKRIALSVDFGTPADAPAGEVPPKGRTACASVPEDGTAAEALADVLGPLRYDSSAMLCAITGYPRTGCGEQVSDTGSGTSEEAAKERTDGSEGTAPTSDDASDGTGAGSYTGAIGGAVVVAVLCAAAVRRARRRRS